MSSFELTSSETRGEWTEVDPRLSWGCTDLMRFIVDCNIEAATLCIKNKANIRDISNIDNKGWTALIYCARLGGDITQIAEFLIQEGVDVNQSDNDGWTPLLHSIATGNTEISQLLVDKGADVNLYNRHKETALMFCAKYGNIEAATLLIENGADVNWTNCDGWVALTYCARYSDSAQIAELLIHHWAEVNSPDLYGWPPLTHCALTGGKEVANALVRNGAGTDQTRRLKPIDKPVGPQFSRTALCRPCVL